MSKQETSTPKLVIEETFAAADDRFVESFRSSHSPKYLASFLEKWLKDARPWSRKQLQDYLGLEWTPLGHDVVYKRIFKHFYAENDHEMMGPRKVADCERFRPPIKNSQTPSDGFLKTCCRKYQFMMPPTDL